MINGNARAGARSKNVNGKHMEMAAPLIGIVSDAHGNGPVFRRMTQLLFELGAQRLIFLGDAVGYVPSLDVVQQLQALDTRVACMLGNHERMLLEPVEPARSDSVYRLNEVRAQLSNGQRSFLLGWPTMLSETLACGRVLFVHGSPHDCLNGYVYPDTPLEPLQGPHAFVFMGHTHRAFIRSCAGTTFVNVGSCGLPRDDGRYASAALFDSQSGGVRIVRLDLASFAMEHFLCSHAVHASVRELFRRRQLNLIGDIIER